MNVIDFLYLIFAGISLYFIFLFLLLFFENRRRMKKTPKITKFPFVSIIIPAHNEEKNIATVIENLKKIDYPKFEIIVVDDGSDDDTAKIAKKHGVKVFSKKKGGKASALNYGLNFTRGDVIACVDADSYPQRDVLLKSIAFFEDPKVAGVTSKIYVKNAKGVFSKLQEIEYAMIAWTRKLFEYIEGIYATPGPFALYRKSVIKKIGGFDEKNATEDIEIAWRILDNGYKIRMSPGKTYTQAPNKLKKWWRQRVRWNIGGLQTTMKYKKSLFKKDSFGLFIIPLFYISYIMSLIALAVFIYLIFFWGFNFFIFSINSILLGMNPFKYTIIELSPNVFTFFGISILILSIILLKFGLSDVKKSVKSCISSFLYLSLYLMIFPFVLIDSMIKYTRGYREW